MRRGLGQGLRRSQALLPEFDNVGAELEGIVLALQLVLERADGEKLGSPGQRGERGRYSLVVLCDCQHAVLLAREGLILRNDGDCFCWTLVLRLKRMERSLTDLGVDCYFNWVPGHCGHTWNEAVSIIWRRTRRAHPLPR